MSDHHNSERKSENVNAYGMNTTPLHTSQPGLGGREDSAEYSIGIEGYYMGKPANLDKKDLNVTAWKHAKVLPKGKGKYTFLDDIIRDIKKRPQPTSQIKITDWA